MYCTLPNASVYNQTILCLDTKGRNFTGFAGVGAVGSAGVVSVRLTGVLLLVVMLGAILTGL